MVPFRCNLDQAEELTPDWPCAVETFELFAQELPSQNLGFVDSKAAALELTVAGRDLTIQQSPSVLSSNRAGGTTGAGWSSSSHPAYTLSHPSPPLPSPPL